ncbi:Diadenosine 5',5'''-P1,P4-tetraphosphate phosphorylase 2 [Beauveria bassiana]|nr:Diadenosine 5',5'''-P1,P4-tetraphosphate phosphorylase 2 [Beauveria bassiana]KAH8716484.1 Diadenosine 5',5'''-P1,P4-tetraphosphate phosphorylase 2 [Beauveria bassiana]KAH8716489.1 Diadenosine 5',5'''-P1,P4-tetraphosphate phosphorylase 2 [Beauveria bassiana]
MDHDYLLSEFDRLVSEGVVLYDDKQTILHQQDGGLTFQFVLTSALNKKPTAATAGEQSKELVEKSVRPGSDIDTNGYEIGHIGSSHVLVANKFCYARPHYLLLTEDGYSRQYEPLNRSDLAAAWALLSSRGNDKLSLFFNCGNGAGYSRLHKHMQLIPTPRNTFASFLDSANGTEPDVPFQWFYQRFSDPTVTSVENVVDTYQKLLRKAIKAIETCQEHETDNFPGAVCSHNVIMTTRWMLVIPRRRPSVRAESGANAMGMLGYIAVSSKADIDNWTDQGLCKLLRQLGVPK